MIDFFFVRGSDVFGPGFQIEKLFRGHSSQQEFTPFFFCIAFSRSYTPDVTRADHPRPTRFSRLEAAEPFGFVQVASR